MHPQSISHFENGFVSPYNITLDNETCEWDIEMKYTPVEMYAYDCVMCMI